MEVLGAFRTDSQRLTRRDAAKLGSPFDVSVPETVIEKMGRGRGLFPARRDREEVNTKGMRKNFALAMVALLALTLALAAVGCGQKKTEEQQTQTPTTTTDTTSMTQDTTMKAESTATK
jgi:hypothetical protein